MNKYPDHEKQIKELANNINEIYKDKSENITFLVVQNVVKILNSMN